MGFIPNGDNTDNMAGVSEDLGAGILGPQERWTNHPFVVTFGFRFLKVII